MNKNVSLASWLCIFIFLQFSFADSLNETILVEAAVEQQPTSGQQLSASGQEKQQLPSLVRNDSFNKAIAEGQRRKEKSVSKTFKIIERQQYKIGGGPNS